MNTLEKAAREYARIPLHKDIDDDERYYNGHAVENYDTFKSGANWAIDTIFNWLKDNMDVQRTVMKDMLGKDMCLEYLTADFKSVDELIGTFKYDVLVTEEYVMETKTKSHNDMCKKLIEEMNPNIEVNVNRVIPSGAQAQRVYRQRYDDSLI